MKFLSTSKGKCQQTSACIPYTPISNMRDNNYGLFNSDLNTEFVAASNSSRDCFKTNSIVLSWTPFLPTIAFNSLKSFHELIKSQFICLPYQKQKKFVLLRKYQNSQFNTGFIKLRTNEQSKSVFYSIFYAWQLKTWL